MTRVVMAGGAGFIGSHVCARLLAEGHEVVALDNLATGSLRNVEPLRAYGRFAYRPADIVDGIPDLGPVDAVFHLASPASPPGYFARPLETALVNSRGTHALLELAKSNGARFLMASTSEAYGDPLEHPQKETYWGNVNPIGERACYDEGKRFGEMLSILYWRTFGVDARVIRIFNTYGPHSDPDDGRVVPAFVSAAIRGQALIVHGDGSQTRSLCYVDDLVDGILKAMFVDGTAGELFNLGNPDERSVLEIARVVNRLCGDRSELRFQPGRPDDPTRRCPDISKARAQLGWEPSTALEEGLGKTIAWFRERLAQPVP